MGAGDQPLPTDEEVIVCDENTTAEEVNYSLERKLCTHRPRNVVSVSGTSGGRGSF